MPIVRKKKKGCQIKNDYHSKNLENPFFRHNHTNNKKKSKKLGWLSYLILFVLLIFLFIYFFLASPLFNIRKINISGLGRLPENDISEKIWQQSEKTKFWPFAQSNIFLFDREEAKKELINNFNFSKVEIDKKLFHTISVMIEERPYAFIWQEAGKSYYNDSKGYIIKGDEVKAEDLLRFPVILNQSGRELATGDYLEIDYSYLSFIFTLKAEVEKNPSLLIDKFIIDQEFKTVKVKFKDGLLAFFNTKEDAAQQLEKMLIVKNEKIKDNLGTINYLDLRYGDKVFIGNK